MLLARRLEIVVAGGGEIKGELLLADSLESVLKVKLLLEVMEDDTTM